MKTIFETPSASIVFHVDLAEDQDHDVQQLEAEGGDDVMLDEALLHPTSEFSFRKRIKWVVVEQIVFVLPMEWLIYAPRIKLLCTQNKTVLITHSCQRRNS